MLKKFVVMLCLLSLAVGTLLVVAGCGPSAEQVAKDAMRVDSNIKTAHAKYATKQVLPRAPIQQGKVAKTVYTTSTQGDYNQQTGNWRAQEELASGVTVTGLWVDNKYYLEIAGNWYEMPASMQPSAPVSKTLSISQYLKYFKTMNKMSDTTIDGEACYHLQGIPSMKDLIKLPGITDLLKDPATGAQTRTVDELADLKGVFDFYIRKKDGYWKRTQTYFEMRASDDIIRLGYAQAGDRVKYTAVTTLSRYNENLELKAPAKVQPWPASSSAPG